MENKDFLEQIYNQMINTVLNGIAIEYQDEVKEEYKGYLNKIYGEKTDIGNKVAILINLEKLRWESASQEFKLKYLLKDDALEKIEKISSLGYSYATQRLRGNNSSSSSPIIDENLCNSNIAEMQDLLNKVRSFNIDVASSLVSEGIIDLKYASLQSDNLSIRLGSETYEPLLEEDEINSNMSI